MKISLTFDDGPDAVITPMVLNLLEKYNIPASFFLIGQNITDETLPLIERELKDCCTIECHSWTHPDFTKLTVEQMTEEVEKTNAKIIEVTGIAPQLFRPPYIAVNDLVYETVKMPFICGRGLDDWVPDVPAEKRAADLINNLHDNEIILLHDMKDNINTVKALEMAIPVLLDRGAEFYTARKLFEVCNVNPNIKGKLWTIVA